MAPAWSWLLVLAALATSGVAWAQPADVDQLAEQLAHAKDFRVRTQAALALGASRSKRAVDPLCGGLGDESSTVRAAAAAALGKLRKGGADCLRRRLAVEEKTSVKAVIERSLARVEADAAPIIGEQTRYLLVLETIDRTGRGGTAVAQVLQGAVQAAAKELPEFAVAPPDSSLDAAKALLDGHPAVRGFLLSAEVQASYAGGALALRIETAIFTLPERNLQGSFTRTLSMQGVSAPDRSAEDRLIQAGGARLLETFAPMAPKFR